MIVDMEMLLACRTCESVKRNSRLRWAKSLCDSGPVSVRLFLYGTTLPRQSLPEAQRFNGRASWKRTLRNLKRKNLMSYVFRFVLFEVHEKAAVSVLLRFRKNIAYQKG